MTVPYRKKDETDTEELTTADLARANRVVELSPTEVEEGRAKPVRSDHSASKTLENRPIPIAEASPLFPDDQLQDLKAHWDKIQTGFEVLKLIVGEKRASFGDRDGAILQGFT